MMHLPFVPTHPLLCSARRLRALAALALVATWLLPGAFPRPALAAAPGCQDGQVPSFVLGFATLRQHVGPAMGEPVTCEFADPSGTGDVHQQTTTGLAFWRRSTNTPTFTDGYRHWALTGEGLVAWTGDSVDPPATASAVPSCFEVARNACLHADAALADAVSTLARTSRGPTLLAAAADAGVVVSRGAVVSHAWGQFRPATRTVTLDSGIDGSRPQARAAVLAHELQHVADWARLGRALETTLGCYATEANAFGTEAAVWSEQWGGNPPAPRDDLEQQLNAITTLQAADPEAFARRLVELYAPECAG